MSSRQSGKQNTRKTGPTTVKAANSTLTGATGGGIASGGAGSNGGPPDSVDSRRLKKRELDRRCQRMARERTKQRIAYLEELVDNFRKQDSSGQVANLMKQLADVQKERDELAKTLKTIANSLRGHEVLNTDTSKSVDGEAKDEVSADELLVHGRTALPCLGNSIPINKNNNNNNTQLLPADDTLTEAAIDGSPEEGPLMLDDNFRQEPATSPEEDSAEARNLASPEVLDPDPVYPKAEESCDCCPKNTPPGFQPPLNIWRYACEALSTRERLPTEIMRMEDAYAEDIPVRAILEGWDSVTAFYGGSLPPLWQKLRQIDEIVFSGMEIKERLACMRFMHLLYSYHSEPTPERKKKLPSWYLKRPSQAIAHSYAIDFFAWPGVRERFVFSQHRYCSNHFWYLFNSCLHVLWPYEFRDCYFRNTTTGQYSISPSFEKRLYDINAWTMGDGLFRQWPEFYSDFPSYNKLPMNVNGGAGAFHGPPKWKALPAPEPEKNHSATQRTISIAKFSEIFPEKEVVPVNSSSAAHTSAPFVTTSQHPITLGNTALTSNPFVSAAGGFYSMQAFDDWWGAPLQLPQHQHPQHQQHQQQQQQGARDMTFNGMGSRSDQVTGLDELSF